MHPLSFDTVESSSGFFLPVLHVVRDAFEVDAIFASVNLLKNLARL